MELEGTADFDLLRDYYQHYFEKEDNPLYAWEAIEFCLLHSRIALPDWIKNYLLNTSRKLLQIDNPKDDAPRLIKDALGFLDGKVFSQRTRYEHMMPVFYKIEERIRRENERRKKSGMKYGKKGERTTQNKLFEEVAKDLNMEAASVIHIYRTIKPIYDAEQQDLAEFEGKKE
jgi:hypothetical protein